MELGRHSEWVNVHIRFAKSIMKRKMREHGFYVVHDLRTDVFMAYESAVQYRAMTMLLAVSDSSFRSLS